jgi:hypothetical protein
MFIMLYKKKVQCLNVDSDKNNSVSLRDKTLRKEMNRICDDKIIEQVGESDYIGCQPVILK